MPTLHDELQSLIADTRAWLQLEADRGVEWFATDAPLPAAGVLPERADDDEEEFVDEAEEEAPASPAATAWGNLASEAREVADERQGYGEVPVDPPGAEGLTVIRDALGNCTRCGLCGGRTNLVFGVGDPTADLMVIGEGPGEQEDVRGEPFVGPAGEMLDKMLAHVLGLPREQVYIANVVKCRPPDNRNPTDIEIATCRPFLERQIRAVQPKLILLLGSVALQAMTGRSGITRNRGKELEILGIPAIPTFHPAYLLRRPAGKREAFADLKLARARYDALGGWR